MLTFSVRSAGLFSYRWEELIANRDKFDLVEALTWNDYGESSYIGPIEGAQPNSQAWVDGVRPISSRFVSHLKSQQKPNLHLFFSLKV